MIALLLAALAVAAMAGGPSTDEPKDTDEVAVLETAKGKIILAFNPEFAPNHVENFKSLVKEGFYDGTRFHRCIAGFMVQGGDPQTKDLEKARMWGTGGKMVDGQQRYVKAEFSGFKHTRGVLSMARSSDPDSASSQFFIMVKDSPFLDGKYSAFGHVVKGMEAVDEIVKTGDVNNNGAVKPSEAVEIKSAKLMTWADAKKTG
ncbi:MAG: peptidylprolyl isomerase [Fimbriimonadaceae bacterium]|nr:peptidylprolyl isomerase [Fimbriimonadaceae bacterium]